MEIEDSPQTFNLKFVKFDIVSYSRCSRCGNIVMLQIIEIPTNKNSKQYYKVGVPYCKTCEPIPSLDDKCVRAFITQKRPEITEKLMLEVM